MNNPRTLIQIRTRKLGLLIYNARLNARRSVEECAAAMGITPETYQNIEKGQAAPSLPQVELLSIYLNIPVEHFWGRQALPTEPTLPDEVENKRILSLRNRLIGASLRLARERTGLSLENLSEQSGIPLDQLRQHEIGELPIPVPELEILASAVGVALDSLYDQNGPIGKRRAQQGKAQIFLELPPEIQEFVCKPVNRPYLDIAQRLSELPVDKLRTLAESLLEITY